MALKSQGNNILAGTSLAIAQIQSPDYVPGTTGWCVFQNGDAEFNAGTFRGYIISGSLFIYNGTPALGNPPVAWITSASTDPEGNSVQPGIFLAELTGSGNARGGLMWNSIVGSEPLLALFPDSTVGFTDHSPFVTGQVFNRGAANEYLSLALGGGAGSGSVSPTMLELFSVSADATLPAHITFYGGASGNEMADLSQSGLQIINQVDTNTYRAGHQLLTASDTTINSTSPITVTGLSTNVGVGTYKVAGSLRVVAAGSGTTQAFRIQFNGTSTVLSACRIRTRSYHEAAGVSINAGTISGLASSGADTGAIANSAVYSVDFEGIITVSTAGTFHVDGLQATSASDETFTVQALSWMELTPA